MKLTLAHAFKLFADCAEQFAMTVISTSHASQFGSHLSQVNRGGGTLRLVWDGKDEYLSLEVSHGPTLSEPAGWVTLFGEDCPGGSVPGPSAPDTDLESALRYGFHVSNAP